MLAAVLTGPDQLELRQLPDPVAGPGEVVVAVGADTICGTDVRLVTGRKTSGVELPVVLGHETAGHVAQVGRGVRGFEVGAPVVMAPVIACLRCWQCRHDLENLCTSARIMGYAVDGGLASSMLVPADAVAAGNLMPVGTDLPSEQLALAEPLACVVYGQDWLGVRPDDAVLVLGAGPIGLLHTQMARLSGARAVIVSEPDAGRRAQAGRLGATALLDPAGGDLAEAVAELAGGLGADAAIVCIGIPELVNQAVRACRTGGRVSAFAGFTAEGWSKVEANQFHYRQVTLTGSANARRADFETAIGLIESGRIDTASMITHRFPLTEVAAAMAMVGSSDAVKVAVLPAAQAGQGALTRAGDAPA